MKRCSKCGEHRECSEFHKNATKHDGLHNICKPCAARRAKTYYDTHRETMRVQIAAASKKRTHKNHQRLLDYLAAHPCVDCGESDPLVLDLDHVRGEKVGHVTAMVVQGWGWSAVEAEIAKCDVRCANCHRRKTAKELGWARAIMLQESGTLAQSGRATGR